MQQPSAESTSSSFRAVPAPLFPPTSQYHPTKNGLARRRRWLVVDFDGTCTEHDTTPLLPRLAALVSRRYPSGVANGNDEVDCNDSDATSARENSEEVGAHDVHERDLQRRLAQFQQLEDEYMRLYGEAKANLLSSADAEGEKSMHEILDALDEPSNIVTGMVSESRVLDGLGSIDSSELEGLLQLYGVADDLDDAVEDDDGSVGEHKIEAVWDDRGGQGVSHDKVPVRLRQGCESTLARILLDHFEKENPSCQGWGLAVLSINWCPALIDASLVRPVLKRRRSLLQIDSCETEVPIWSNRVDGEGNVALHVPGALAKRDKISELRRRIHSTDGGPSVIIYVGDSSTDLAALLEADIGIVIGSSSSMLAIAERWGIRIEPLRHRARMADWRKEEMLWQVETWHDIDEMLLELDSH
ncbi:hypothetical protein ACHAXT_002898 [Thalassiosira profunda]